MQGFSIRPLEQDLLMVTNQLRQGTGVATMNEILTENFIAKQRDTGVESFYKKDKSFLSQNETKPISKTI